MFDLKKKKKNVRLKTEQDSNRDQDVRHLCDLDSKMKYFKPAVLNLFHRRNIDNSI